MKKIKIKMNTAKIQVIIRNYFKISILDNLEETKEFLNTYILPSQTRKM